MNMKKIVYVIMGLVMLICLSFSALGVNALQSSEWNSTVNFDRGIYYQGDSGSVTPTFYSHCPDQLTITSISVQFDWATTENTITVSSPNIATGNQYTPSFGVSFSIPSEASVSSHSYTITYKGQQKGLFGWYDISVSATGSISVHDAYEKIYNQNIQSISSTLTRAFNANYRSPDAQALLQQAQSMYNQATSLANQGQWQGAVNDINTASSYASQAAAKEATYVPPTPVPTPTPTAPEFPAVAILAGFLVLSIVAATLVTVKKRKNDALR